MKKLAIFDLDGTLIDSIADLGAATNYALSCYGLPTHPLDTYPMRVGNGVNKLIERALPEEERSPERVAQLRQDFTRYYNDHCTDLTRPYPGIVELLADLQGENVAIAVASNKYQHATEKLVRHFFPDIDFLAICGQRDGIPIKPDPSVVFEIIGKAAVPKADVIYIGDSGVDIETARRACVDSIGVAWGFRTAAELAQAGAGTIVDTPNEIFNIIIK
ncbi:MAG: HAD family hydrolase [Candidatus Limisoma sp.]